MDEIANDSLKNKLKRVVRKTHYAISIIRSVFKGSGEKTCPCCDYQGPFETVGSPPRYGALCPKCGSFERHRLLALSDRKFNYFLGKEVLHFAPEMVIAELVSKKSSKYITADIMDAHADRFLNIEKIEDDDNAWDVIICSHVLEHVDDMKALAELYRVLRENGVLIVMVPIVEGWDKTYENENVHTESERAMHFGQNDHMRYYGRDIRERISSQGFVIEEYTAYGDDVVDYSLLRGEKVFICRKPKQ